MSHKLKSMPPFTDRMLAANIPKVDSLHANASPITSKRTCKHIENAKAHSGFHRGQTSRAAFRFISRHFIHREVETQARIYIIAVESKCIPISLT